MARRAERRKRRTQRERDREALQARTERAGGVVVFHGEAMFVVVLVGGVVTARDESGNPYGSGVWKGCFVAWHGERSLDWRLLDKIDLALRRKARSYGGRRAFRPASAPE